MRKYSIYALGFIFLLSGCASVPNYLNEGKQLQSKGDDEAALKKFTRAVKNDSNPAEAYYRRGNIYFDQKKDDQAIKDYTSALRINPNLINAYFNRGLAYEAQGEYKKALQDFLKVVELRPNDAEAHKNIGIIYDEYIVGEKERTLAHYKRYIELGGRDKKIKQRIKKLEVLSDE